RYICDRFIQRLCIGLRSLFVAARLFPILRNTPVGGESEIRRRICIGFADRLHRWITVNRYIENRSGSRSQRKSRPYNLSNSASRRTTMQPRDPFPNRRDLLTATLASAA